MELGKVRALRMGQIEEEQASSPQEEGEVAVEALLGNLLRCM